MRTRILVTAFIAAATALLTTVVPASHAVGPIREVTIGGSSAAGGVTIIAVPPQQPLTFTVSSLIGQIPFACNGGGFTGAAWRGTASASPSPITPNPALSLWFANVPCSSVYGASTLWVDCDIDVVMDDIVTSGVDSAVEGRLYATNRSTGTACLSVEQTGGCSFRIGGNVPVAFNETTQVVGGTNNQELTIIGSGLRVVSPTAECFGVVRANDAVVLAGSSLLIRTSGTYQQINFSD